MHIDTFLVPIVCILFVALVCGWLLDRLKQPAIMGYIFAGGLLGTIFSDVLPDRRIFEVAGEAGLIFMLFFIGSEVDVRRLVQNWKIALAGTAMQIVLSVLLCLLAALFVKWSFQQTLFFGFIISLSSTAVVLKLLDEFGGLSTPLGRNCLGILLAQDLAIIPMLIILGVVGGEAVEISTIIRQVAGALILVGGGMWLSAKGGIPIPKFLELHRNRDFQIFMGLIFCLGAASITGIFGLSPALGAFIAGMVLRGSSEGEAMHKYLEPFRVLFVATFFVFVGLIFDLRFFIDHLGSILLLVLLVFVVNTLINGFVLRFLGIDKVSAMITACILAQIGEFAFLLSSTALNLKVINSDTYQTSVAVITLTLILTPIWISLARRMMRMSWGESGTMIFQQVKKNPDSSTRQH